jgi:hypothetical protein
MLLNGYGVTIDLPTRWDGRIFQLPDTGPTVHAGNFAVSQDNDGFGSMATDAMRPGNIFLAVVEYVDIAPRSEGPYSTEGAPTLSLDSTCFVDNLQQGSVRPGRAGLQGTFYVGPRCFLFIPSCTGTPASTLVPSWNSRRF